MAQKGGKLYTKKLNVYYFCFKKKLQYWKKMSQWKQNKKNTVWHVFFFTDSLLFFERWDLIESQFLFLSRTKFVVVVKKKKKLCENLFSCFVQGNFPKNIFLFSSSSPYRKKERKGKKLFFSCFSGQIRKEFSLFISAFFSFFFFFFLIKS